MFSVILTIGKSKDSVSSIIFCKIFFGISLPINGSMTLNAISLFE